MPLVLPAGLVEFPPCCAYHKEGLEQAELIGRYHR